MPDDVSPTGETVVPRGAADATSVLTCSRCGANYDVRNWTPTRTVRCPGCSAELVTPRVEGVLDAATPSTPGGLASAPAGKPFGRYRLIEPLGQGGMGVVWKAWDTQLERRVAIKGLLTFGQARPAQLERFEREARAAAKLRQPNIVTVHDVGVIEGQPYICADLVDAEGAPCAAGIVALGDAERFSDVHTSETGADVSGHPSPAGR